MPARGSWGGMDERLPAPSAHDALAALNDLPRYEETLTSRTGGLTSMLWGLVGAGIFLTYATASDLIEANGVHWVYALLWMPWVAAGIAFTGALWTNHAVSLRRDPHVMRGLRFSLTLVAFFLAMAGLLYLALDLLAGVEWTVHALMTVVNGLFAFGLGAVQVRQRHAGGRWVVAAGFAMVASGLAIGAAGFGDDAAALAGAAATATAWIAAGGITYRQG